MKRNANKPADPGGRRPSTLSDLINDDSYIPKPASASTMFEDDEEDDNNMVSISLSRFETSLSRTTFCCCFCEFLLMEDIFQM